MPLSCYVPGCKSTACAPEAIRGSVRFYRFPREAHTLDQWKKSLGLPTGFKVLDYARICSLHFVCGVKEASLPTNGILFVAVPTRPLPRNRYRTVPSGDTPSPKRPHDSESPLPIIQRARESPPNNLVQDSAPQKIDAVAQTSIEQEDKLIQTNEHPLEEHCKKLEEELQTLRLASSKKEAQLLSCIIRIESIREDDSLVRFYTGFTSFSYFQAFLDFLGNSSNCLHYWKQYSRSRGQTAERQRYRTRQLSPVNECLLTLCRLRLGLLEDDLAFRFGISKSEVSNIIITWITCIYHELSAIDWWPSKETIVGTMPRVFKEHYSNTRCIVDATELRIETPSDRAVQSATYSSYKHHNTLKAPVCIAPSGGVIFVSRLYTGSISDPELTRRSGLLDKLESGDHIMADRSYNS